MIYTAICGDKEKPRSDIKVFGGDGIFATPRMEAKRYKVLSHLFVNSDVSVWVDGNISLKVSEEVLVRKWLGDADIAMFKHPYRKRVLEEIAEVCRCNLDTPFHCYESLRDLSRETFPLVECSVVIRRHNPATLMFNETWWSLICRYSSRDQITAPTALRRTVACGMKLALKGGNVRSHPMFDYVPHAK